MVVDVDMLNGLLKAFLLRPNGSSNFNVLLIITGIGGPMKEKNKSFIYGQ